MAARLLRVARVGDPASARVLAARLEAEGIEVHLRGEWLGPYPITVGQMGVSELYVPEESLEEARLVLLAAEVDDVLSEPRGTTPPPVRAGWVLVAAAILTMVVWGVLRLAGVI